MREEGPHGVSVFQLPLQDGDDGPLAERAGPVVGQRGNQAQWSGASPGFQTSSVCLPVFSHSLVVIIITKDEARAIVPEVARTTTIARTTVIRAPVLLSFTDVCLFARHFYFVDQNALSVSECLQPFHIVPICSSLLVLHCNCVWIHTVREWGFECLCEF